MKNLLKILFTILLTAFFINCHNDEIDREKPVIDLQSPDASPGQCDTLYFGDTFYFRSLFRDNAELGSFSIDIHHNFDHHSHSTEIKECQLSPVKTPVNPFSFIEDYPIPAGLNEYHPNLSIVLPVGNTKGIFDSGDYHFTVNLTDKEGWSTFKGLSIKILHR